MLASALALVLLAQAAPATTTPAAPAAPGEDLAITDDATRMTVAVSVADRGPFAFIIDTGAERTVLSRDLAGSLTLPSGPMVSVMAVTGPAPAPSVRVPALRVGTLTQRDLLTPVLERRNLGALGILGIDILRGHTVSVDFERRVMSVVASRRRNQRQVRAPDEIIVTAQNLLGQLVVTDAFYRGHRVRVVLDTGSVVTIGNTAFQRLALRDAPTTPVNLISVTGDRLQAQEAPLDHLTIGGVELGNLPVAFAEAAPFARFGLTQQPAIMLGMDTMRNFRRVDIDFANRQVRFLLPRRTPGANEAPMGLREREHDGFDRRYGAQRETEEPSGRYRLTSTKCRPNRLPTAVAPAMLIAEPPRRPHAPHADRSCCPARHARRRTAGRHPGACCHARGDDDAGS